MLCECAQRPRGDRSRHIALWVIGGVKRGGSSIDRQVRRGRAAVELVESGVDRWTSVRKLLCVLEATTTTRKGLVRLNGIDHVWLIRCKIRQGLIICRPSASPGLVALSSRFLGTVTARSPARSSTEQPSSSFDPPARTSRPCRRPPQPPPAALPCVETRYSATRLHSPRYML